MPPWIGFSLLPLGLMLFLLMTSYGVAHQGTSSTCTVGDL